MIDPSNPLSQLKDIQLPDPIGWWPLAFSWWVLIFSLSAMVFAAIWLFLDRHRRNAYRREAQQQLKAIENNPALDTQSKILHINALLKQVAITIYGRQTIARLNEQAWVEFLKANAQFISQPPELKTLLTQAYQPTEHLTPADLQRALNAWQGYAQQWIKGHHL